MNELIETSESEDVLSLLADKTWQHRDFPKWRANQLWREILNSHPDKFRYSVTLTFRVQVDKDQAATALKHFMTKLNRTIYGRDFSKNKQFVHIIPVLHGADSGETRIHYHALIGSEVGIGRTLGEVRELIHAKWSEVKINGKPTRVDVVDAWRHGGGTAGYLRYSTRNTNVPLDEIARSSFDDLDTTSLNHPLIPKK